MFYFIVAGDTEMVLRIASAAVCLPLLILIIWFGSFWFSMLVVVAAAVGSFEFCRLAIKWGHKPRAHFVTIWAVVFVAGAHFMSSSPVKSASGAILILTLAIIIVGTVISLAWMLWLSRRGFSLTDWIITNIAALYTGGLLSYAVLIRGLDQGREWILLSLGVIFVSDTLALIVGKIIGRHPIAPKISPQKTWEGSLGSFVGGVVAGVILTGLLDIPITVGIAAIFGIGLSIVGQLGDLAQSRMKRAAGVKDSGRVVPGHGGLLDRLDSVVFNMPLVYYFVLWGIQ